MCRSGTTKVRTDILTDTTSAAVKISKARALQATFRRPDLRFEQQRLTSCEIGAPLEKLERAA